MGLEARSVAATLLSSVVVCSATTEASVAIPSLQCIKTIEIILNAHYQVYKTIDIIVDYLVHLRIIRI